MGISLLAAESTVEMIPPCHLTVWLLLLVVVASAVVVDCCSSNPAPASIFRPIPAPSSDAILATTGAPKVPPAVIITKSPTKEPPPAPPSSPSQYQCGRANNDGATIKPKSSRLMLYENYGRERPQYEDDDDEEINDNHFSGDGANNENNGARIVGGLIADRNEFPWLVRLVITKSIGPILCGASIISENWLLTAAHCVYDIDSVGMIVTTFGEWDAEQLDSGEYTVPILSVLIHPKFNLSTKHDFDFALLRVARTLDLALATTQKICLPSSCSNDGCGAGTAVEIAGWGAMSGDKNGDTPSRYLQKAMITVINQDGCVADYASAQIRITSQMFCAGRRNADSCQGDSGGPLMSSEDDRYTLCGVTSFGKGCARKGFNGVYAKVCTVLDWIRANTGI